MAGGVEERDEGEEWEVGEDLEVQFGWKVEEVGALEGAWGCG